MRDAEQRADERVALGLLQHPFARIEQDHRQVGRRGAGHHVARVLLVARAIGNDEASLECCEIAVGHVDRDPLLALGAQPVGQQRQVERPLAAAALACLSHMVELVLEHLLGVVQQAADQRALAVVYRAGGCEAQQVERHCPALSADAGELPLQRAARPVAWAGAAKKNDRTRSTRPSCDPPSRPLRRGRQPASLRAR